ncbi:P-loop containing nucleoside triphosphate hydrolase protein [Mycena rosella]|uniref:P-loop containing nucleoside triphosphate hydrolase protein n=1 Tax=Mycena rosella TaxID=1033263 RepID=A0AAD7FNI4_MYCRO|nr:P-loop containing nucleoside triphosphate hydrolase protein [Mycena rosella]
MSSPVTRSSVLGKRPHHPELSTPTTDTKRQLQTPDNTPNPKRPRTSNTAIDGDGNKENVPPFNTQSIASPPSPRATRALRRTTTSDGSPSRVRQAVSRRASTSAIVPATPTAEIAQLTLATPPPTPPTLLLPIHARARALLRATCNNPATEMAGRDSERAAISAFFASLIDQADEVEHTSLYISGSPGTGKTALVNSVLCTLGVDEIKVININCMALNSIDVLWERLVEELGGYAEKKRRPAGRPKKSQGRDIVDALLTVVPTKCIIILDELDHIAPTAQSLSSLFSLSASRPSTLRVVGIANTHTLTASSSAGFVPSSSNVRTLHFAPYTPAQLLQILQSRLAPLYVSESPDDVEGAESASQAAKKFLSPAALNLLTKKIAALTETHTPLPLHQTPRAGGIAVSPAATNSEIVTKIRSLGLHARLALLALLLASKRLEAGLPLSSTSNSSSPMKRGASSFASAFGAVDPTHLHAFISPSCRAPATACSRPSRAANLAILSACSKVLASSCAPPRDDAVHHVRGSRVESQARVRALCFVRLWANRGGGGAGDVQLASAVRTDEVLRGLGIGMVEKAADEDVAVEEVNAIWVKENGRLARDTTARDNKAKKDKVTAGFEDAWKIKTRVSRPHSLWA